MKRTPRIPLLLAAIVCASCWDSGWDTHRSINFESAPPSTLGDGHYQYGATIDGRMTWWNVTFAEVARTPDWTPGTEPPLSVAKAVELAQSEVEKYTNTPAAYRLDTVELLHLGNHMPQKNKWIYVVNFERDYEFQGRAFAQRGTIRIPVLFDGTVIQGKPEKPAA